jgi:hypothetical protein
MAMAARQLGQSHAIGFDQANTSLLRAFDELPHARVATRSFKINLNDRLRRRFETNTHCVETK